MAKTGDRVAAGKEMNVKRKPQVIVAQDPFQDWRWLVRASSGIILAESGMGYASAAGARRAWKRLGDVAAAHGFEYVEIKITAPSGIRALAVDAMLSGSPKRKHRHG